MMIKLIQSVSARAVKGCDSGSHVFARAGSIPALRRFLFFIYFYYFQTCFFNKVILNESFLGSFCFFALGYFSERVLPDSGGKAKCVLK